MIKNSQNQIIHFENVDKWWQVSLQSPNMEREGMIRCLEFLISRGLKVNEVVTDSSTLAAKALGN